MRARHKGHEIGGRFVKAQVFAFGSLDGGDAHFGGDDEMPDLVGDDVEVEGEWHRFVILQEIGAELEEAETGLRVVVVGQQRDLQPVEVRLEVPGDAAAEVAFPDVEHEAGAAEHVRRLEFRHPRLEVVEVSLLVRQYRRRGGAVPGRKIDVWRPIRPVADAVGLLLGCGLDHEHALVRRAGTEAPRR